MIAGQAAVCLSLKYAVGSCSLASTISSMLFAAAAPWFYWLAMLLFLGSIGGVIAVMIGYYVKVIANRSPRRERRR